MLLRGAGCAAHGTRLCDWESTSGCLAKNPCIHPTPALRSDICRTSLCDRDSTRHCLVTVKAVLVLQPLWLLKNPENSVWASLNGEKSWLGAVQVGLAC